MPYYDGDRSESPLHLPEHSSTQGPHHPSLAPPGNGSPYGAAVPVNPLPPALAATPDVMSLLKALKRHWLLAGTLGIVAATLASAAVWYFMPVKYTAQALLALNSLKLVKSGVGDERETASPFTRDTLLALAKTREMIRAALDEEGMMKLPSIREQLDPVGWLQARLEVTPVSSELVAFSLSGPDPRELEQLVNAVARVYEKKLGQREQQIRMSQVTKLDKMIERLQGFVNKKMEEYKQMVKEIGATNSGQRLVKAHYEETLLDTLLKDRVFHQTKLKNLELKLKQSKDRKEGEVKVPRLEVEKELKEERAYKALNAQIGELEEEIIQGEQVYLNKKHPRLEEAREKLKKLENERKQLRKKLLPEIRKKLVEYYAIAGEDSEEDIKDEIALTKQLLDAYTDEMDRLSEQVKRGGSEGLELDLKKQEFEVEQAVVNNLRDTRTRLNAQVLEPTSTATVQEQAHGYQSNNAKKQIMMAGGAGCAALGLVLLGFAYWEFRARRVNTVEDVVYGLGWRLVGQLPALPERARGGLLRKQADPRYWQSLMTESVDATRTMILHAARVDGIRTVMVTSAVSGEGKTSLSCHLACSLARAGRKTLLLDCDLRNPASHRLFDLPGEPGICEVLRREARLTDVIRATPASNLWLIPAGQFDEQALQMLTLSQEGFSSLLEQLKTQFDFIVVDSSPVLPVVDTLVIGQNVDVVVFSLLRDVSRIPSVYAAYQRLATLDIRILGAVVNGVDAGSYGYAPQYASYIKQPV